MISIAIAKVIGFACIAVWAGFVLAVSTGRLHDNHLGHHHG